MDTSGRALVTFLKWAGDKGQMKINTANALRGATMQVLKVLDGWESLDMRALDVDDTCRRFVNKRNQEFTPESMESYKRRFAQSVKEFLRYAEDPSSWKFSAKEREVSPARERKGNGIAANDDTGMAQPRAPTSAPVISGLVEYPFPLREGRPVYLRLPMDLKMAEVKRLTAYLNTLAVDAEAA
jgi:hypothetical protein